MPGGEVFKNCPGGKSLDGVVRGLGEHKSGLESFKANGSCVAAFHDDGRLRKESFALKAWFCPPALLRVHGDIGFDARGLDVGSNAEEFWFAVKPKQVGSSYVWGKWTEQEEPEKTFLNNRILLDVLGAVEVSKTAELVLSSEDVFYVIEEKAGGEVLRRIYIYRCDGRVRKIEYCAEGKVRHVAEVEYVKAFKEVSVPSLIRISNINASEKKDTIEIRFNSAKSYEFSEARRKIFFKRPTNMKGYKEVYRLVDGELVKEN